MNKPLKITIIVVSSILALVLIILAFVSIWGGNIAKNYLNNHGEDLLGRKLSVQNVDLSLFSGHVAIHNVSLKEDDGTSEFAGWDTLDTRVALIPLIAHKVNVRHIRLAGLRANIIQNDSIFNFTSLINHFASSDTTAESDTTPSDWVVNLHNIMLAHGNVSYADVVRNCKYNIKDLNLHVPDFSIGGNSNTTSDISLELAGGGSLNANLNYDPQSDGFDANIAIRRLPLEQARPYIQDALILGPIGGSISLEAAAKGTLSDIMAMDLSANVNIENIDICDKNEHHILRCNHIGAKSQNLDLKNNRFELASLSIEGLLAHYDQLSPTTTNIDPIFPPKKASTSEKSNTPDTAANSTTDTANALQLLIHEFRLSKTNLTYSDFTLPEEFTFPITNLTIEADDLQLVGENKAHLSANLPDGGRIVIHWLGNISHWKEKQFLVLNISDLHLQRLSPYLLKYTAQPFEEGRLSFVSKNSIHHKQLDGNNHLDIYRASVGSRRSDIDSAMRLPLKAALYVLKDKDDKIVLDLPIAGNIDQPEFNYMKLVWKTLGNLIVKVVTSPARALGNALGLSETEDNDFIPIDTTSSQFSSEQFYQIDHLCEMLRLDENIQATFTLTRPIEKLPEDSTNLNSTSTTTPPSASTPTTHNLADTHTTKHPASSQNHDRYALRNKNLEDHILSLGIKSKQFKIITNEESNPKKIGYRIVITDPSCSLQPASNTQE